LVVNLQDIFRDIFPIAVSVDYRPLIIGPDEVFNESGREGGVYVQKHTSPSQIVG